MGNDPKSTQAVNRLARRTSRITTTTDCSNGISCVTDVTIPRSAELRTKQLGAWQTIEDTSGQNANEPTPSYPRSSIAGSGGAPIHDPMTACRETDLLGHPATCRPTQLWGIHTVRAMENFPLADRPVHRGLVHAYGAVKLAAARTNHELGRWDDATFAAIETACQEMIDRQARRARRRRRPAGRRRHLDQHERQRGAGQSGPATARPAAGRLSRPSARTTTSTCTSRPTTRIRPRLRVAAIFGLHDLERKVVALLEAFQAEGEAVRRRGQDRPHRAAGRRADDARPRDGRLRRGASPATAGGSTSARSGCAW